MAALHPRLNLDLELPPELADYQDPALYGSLKVSLDVHLTGNLQRGDRLHITVRDEDADEVGTAVVRDEDADEVGTAVVRVVAVELKDVTAEGRVIASERVHKAKVTG